MAGQSFSNSDVRLQDDEGRGWKNLKCSRLHVTQSASK
jgi:hypothetical protein